MRRALLCLLPFAALLFTGCSQAAKKETIDPITPPAKLQKYKRKPEPAVRTVPVQAQNFAVDAMEVPDNVTIKRAKIMGAPLTDVISLLSEATGESIVFQLESQSENFDNDDDDNDGIADNNNDREDSGAKLLTQADVYLSASNIGVGTLLEKAVGNRLSVSYEQGTYYLGFVKNVTLKIPAVDKLGESLVESLKTFGANKVVYDAVTSSISFSARTKEYKEIMEYLLLLRNNLYVIEYSMEIYNVQLSDEYNLGIDWEMIPSAAKSTGLVLKSATESLASGVPYQIGVVKNDNDYESASAILNILEHFGKVESVQRPTLLGLAGTDVTLKDGTEEAYIKSFQTTLVNNGGAQTSTVSDTALSGLEITLNSNIMDETVVTSIEMEINDIVGYTSFNLDNQEYKQPKISTKKIQNTVRVEPGVPIVISGLYRQKHDAGHKGVPGTSGTVLNNVAGSDYRSSTKSEMVIIVTPRIIKYVMQ